MVSKPRAKQVSRFDDSETRLATAVLQLRREPNKYGTTHRSFVKTNVQGLAVLMLKTFRIKRTNTR